MPIAFPPSQWKIDGKADRKVTHEGEPAGIASILGCILIPEHHRLYGAGPPDPTLRAGEIIEEMRF
jgi:hypothetical protein